ncbi:hypothetical protein FNF28_05904 [Cafeteria roenbergensis]|uniref:Uncharacterized protein n=2 Tax=Cafeteria roenbergensis TaxID=33653 RepID=A0A5A8D239_CAFRO|nr:hypothetical protein FNF28_05904 [Cafeteria roenbergensis]
MAVAQSESHSMAHGAEASHAGGARTAFMDAEQFFDILRSFKDRLPGLIATANHTLRKGTHVRRPGKVKESTMRLRVTSHLRHQVWSYVADHVKLPHVTAEYLDLRFKRHFNAANATWKVAQQQASETSTATQARRAAGKPDVIMTVNEELLIFYATEFGVVCHLELSESIRKRVEATAQPPLRGPASHQQDLVAAASGSGPWSLPEAATDSSLDSSADSDDGELVPPRSSTGASAGRPSQTSGSWVGSDRAAHAAAGQSAIEAARLARQREKKRAREEERLRQLEGLRSKRPNTALLASMIGGDHEPRDTDPRQMAVEMALKADVFQAITVLEMFQALHPDGCALHGVALSAIAKALLFHLSADDRTRLGFFLIPHPDAQKAVVGSLA